MGTAVHAADKQVRGRDRVEEVLPARVQEALGELVGAAKSELPA